MHVTPRLAESLVEFARTLTGKFDISDVLNDLSSRVTSVLDIAGAGVSLFSGTEVSYATASSEQSAIVERVQGDRQSGPCVEAILTSADLLIENITEESQRWPEYVAAADTAGIAAVAALPMRNTIRIGALSLYDTRVRQWTPAEVVTARVFADMATGYVLSASELERERRTVEQLQQALDSRVIIEQAKGIVANEYGISVDAAFVRIRKYARSHSASLRSVAHAVVALGLRV